MVKARKKGIVGIFVSAFIILMAVILTIFLLPLMGMKARAQEIERDFSSLEAKIDGIDLLSAIGASSDTKVLVEENKALFSIGIGGIPLLMEKLEGGLADETSEGGLKGLRAAFYLDGLYYLLDIDRMDILLDDDYVDYTADSPYHPEYAGIKKLVMESGTVIPEIIASSQPMEEKLEALSKYGILSIPYVNAKIEAGEEAYAAYYTKIGLHDTQEERANQFLHIAESPSSPGLSDGLSAVEADFDYEEWNNANRYDMEILRDYIEQLN